jgi:hypothetical protein
MNDKLLERLVTALETLALCVDRKKKTVRTVDVERGKVYKTHLGKKLR